MTAQDSSVPGPERARLDAEARGLPVEFLRRESTGRPTLTDFGGTPMAKSVVVKQGDSFAFVIAPLDSRFSWPRLRGYLGVNRISLPDADVAFEATGYRPGTISPLGAATAWPVYIDQSLAGTTIMVGSGEPQVAARIDVDAFAAAYGAEFVDLADPV